MFFGKLLNMNNNIDVKQAKMCIDGGVILVDVRTKEEYKNSHIEGGVNIDILEPNFKNQIEKLDRSKSYIICCASGSRSAKATKIMIEMGFEDVHNMLGGMMDWEKAGLPVVG
jgi:rhodanese-related sulfurtransferase